MTYWFLLLLAAAWIAVFLPAVMRARQNAPLSTAERFRRRMELIAPRANAGRWVVMPEDRDRLRGRSFRKGQRLRRRLLVLLLSASAASLLAAIVVGGAMWEIALAFVASLGIYVVLLLEAKRRRTERAEVVRRIPTQERHVESEAFVASHADVPSFETDLPSFDEDMSYDDQIRAYGARRF